MKFVLCKAKIMFQIEGITKAFEIGDEFILPETFANELVTAGSLEILTQ